MRDDVETSRALARAAAITIDVDTLACYRAIHGLPQADDARDPTYPIAMERFFEIVDGLHARATVFVIGRDLDDATAAARVRAAHDGGHEIASHSHAHDYALSRRAPAVIDADLARASDAIARVAGRRPRGFRAPGYNLSEPLVDALDRHGFVYDSSIFPTPAYFAARAIAIGAHALAGRESRSLVGDAREFAGPRAPYRPAVGARHRAARRGERARALVEIPMAVATRLRAPWLGTTISLAHDAVGDALTRFALRARGPVVLELHAMDLLGHDDGVDRALVAVQPDLRVSSRDKVRRVTRAVRALVERRDTITLEEMAARVA